MQAEENRSEDYQTRINVPQGQSVEAMLSQLAGYSRQRGCVPIPIDFFTKVLPTLSEAELRVYLYQLYRTLGFGKQSDSIANGQFLSGIVDKQGEVIDRGCGLKSVKSVRKATQSLAQKRLVKRSRRRSHQVGDQPNEFAITLTLLSTKKSEGEKPEVAEKKRMGEGIQITPQNASTKRNKQRCLKKRMKKSVLSSIRSRQTKKSPLRKRHPKRFMDSDHVDYLIDQMEQVTGDSHSRGAFAQIAMSVAEGKILELLAVVKDRGNIRNKGAWFLTTSRKHVGNLTSNRCAHSEVKKTDIRAKKQAARPDACNSHHSEIPKSVSLKELLWSKKHALAQKLGLPRELGCGVAHIGEMAQIGEKTTNCVRAPSVFSYGQLATVGPP